MPMLNALDAGLNETPSGVSACRLAGSAVTTKSSALKPTLLPAASNRLTAVNESFVARVSVKTFPDAGAVPAGGFTFQSVTFSNGPVKPSRTRSNCTPIWNASVQPALSYGGVGGAPGYGITFG